MFCSLVNVQIFLAKRADMNKGLISLAVTTNINELYRPKLSLHMSLNEHIKPEET